MSGARFLEIVGAMHLVAYAIMGFSFAFTLFVDWSARQFKLKADMLRVYAAILKELADKRRSKGGEQ
jgi:hypothetical protein